MDAGRFFYSSRSARYSVFKAAEFPSLIPSYIPVITTPLYSPPTRLSNVHSCPLVIYILVLWTTPGTPVGQDLVRRTHEKYSSIVQRVCKIDQKCRVTPASLSYSSSRMSRMVSGSGLGAGCSEGGCGEWGVGVGVVVPPLVLSLVCSGGPSAGSACRASVVLAIAGSSLGSVGVAVHSPRFSCARVSASMRNLISSSPSRSLASSRSYLHLPPYPPSLAKP